MASDLIADFLIHPVTAVRAEWQSKMVNLIHTCIPHKRKPFFHNSLT